MTDIDPFIQACIWQANDIRRAHKLPDTYPIVIRVPRDDECAMAVLTYQTVLVDNHTIVDWSNWEEEE